MDIINSRAMKISELAMDCTVQRHKLIASNIANMNTEGYQRVDLKFEDQLVEILRKEEENKFFSQQQKGPKSSINFVLSADNNFLDKEFLSERTQKKQFNQNPYKEFAPTVYTDYSSPMSPDGNNVNIEKEMALQAKNGTRYTALAEIQTRLHRLIENSIKSSS